jgi:hypothetical protein
MNFIKHKNFGVSKNLYSPENVESYIKKNYKHRPRSTSEDTAVPVQLPNITEDSSPPPSPPAGWANLNPQAAVCLSMGTGGKGARCRRV